MIFLELDCTISTETLCETLNSPFSGPNQHVYCQQFVCYIVLQIHDFPLEINQSILVTCHFLICHNDKEHDLLIFHCRKKLKFSIDMKNVSFLHVAI